MKFSVSLFLITLFASQSAFAGQCYKPREAEAEQGIRIHSELMVIGLNCAHMPTKDGKNLYVEHKKFTQRHSDLFGQYEKIMKGYLGRNGSGNSEKALHTLRTDFANKVSEDAANMRPDIFCKTYSSRIEQVTKMNRETLRKWAVSTSQAQPLTQKRCTTG